MARRLFLLGLIALSTVGCDDSSSTMDAGPRGRTDAGTTPRRDAGPPSGDCAGGPLAAPIPNCMPTPLPSTGDVRQDCVDRINQFRMECQCLPPLERWTAGEDCADQQAQYDAERGTPHAGFSMGICSPRGNGQNECPGWGNEAQVIRQCLQQMWDEGPGEPFSEHGHYINMSNTSFSRVACGFHDHASGLWAVQNFQ